MVTCNFVARLLKLLALHHATELVKLCTDRFATGHTYTLKLFYHFFFTFSVTGQIRTTIGQAQLLIDQRFRQFSGLIDLSEVSLCGQLIG